jgi:hypothetical protein
MANEKGADAVKRFEFEIVHLDRIEIRERQSAARRQLESLGAEGWHIVHIKDDAQHGRDLLFFLERETGASS